MGCFLSSTKRSPQNPASTSPPQTKPLVEEETVVKEVLSETPSIIQPKPTIPTHEINNIIPKKVDDKFSINTCEPRQKYPPHDHQSVVKIAKIFNPKDHEPTSQRMGSDTKEAVKELSRSLRVGSGELCRGVQVGSGPRDVGAQRSSPAKCRSSSPARRSELCPGRVRNPGGLSRKENNGGSSFRRPVVMCGENDGTRNSISRCPSARTGKSPGRVRSELGDPRRMPNSYKGSMTGRNNESLENPLVSMECFIFL